MHLVQIPDLSSAMLLYVSADTVNLSQRTESGASEAAAAHARACVAMRNGKCLCKRSGVDVHTECFDVEVLVNSCIPDFDMRMELW